MQPYKKESNTYCDVCRVWISNHAQAIRNHEMGSGHKDKMQQSASHAAARCAARSAPATAARHRARVLRHALRAPPQPGSASLLSLRHAMRSLP